MLKKILKWTAVTIGGLALFIFSAYAFIHYKTDQRLARIYDVRVRDLPIPTDSASIAYGRHVLDIRGCVDCHGKDLGGKVVIDDPALGYIAGPNLTAGHGGLGQAFTSEDWVRGIRHGISREGKTLLLMPSHEFHPLSDRDISSLIAYLKTVRPVDRQMAANRVGPMLRTLYQIGKFPNLAPAELIKDQNAVSHYVEREGVSLEKGQYLTVTCTGCHGEDFKGRDLGIPGVKPSVDITRSGNPGKWSESEFISTLRTGRTPEGRTLNPKDMPWPVTANYSDEELQSVYVYLRSLE